MVKIKKKKEKILLKKRVKNRSRGKTESKKRVKCFKCLRYSH
jgi:hypothetical protein